MDASPTSRRQQGQAKDHQGQAVQHAKWAGHITSACQGKGLKDPKTNQQQEPPPSPQTMARLGLTRALSALGASDSK